MLIIIYNNCKINVLGYFRNELIYSIYNISTTAIAGWHYLDHLKPTGAFQQKYSFNFNKNKVKL